MAKKKYPDKFVKTQILCYALQHFYGFYEPDLREWLRKNIGVRDIKTIKAHLKELENGGYLEKREEPGYPNLWFVPDLKAVARMLEEYSVEFDLSKIQLPVGAKVFRSLIEGVLASKEVFNELYGQIDYLQPGLLKELMQSSKEFAKLLISNLDDFKEYFDELVRGLKHPDLDFYYRYSKMSGGNLMYIYGPGIYFNYPELIFCLELSEFWYYVSWKEKSPNEELVKKIGQILELKEIVKGKDIGFETLLESFYAILKKNPNVKLANELTRIEIELRKKIIEISTNKTISSVNELLETLLELEKLFAEAGEKLLQLITKCKIVY